MPTAYTHEFTVIRDSHEETTFAEVRCWFVNADLAELKKAFVTAVSEWIEKYPHGREAFLKSEKDFNIGDLSLYSDDEDLYSCLAKHGITMLDLETHTADGTPVWDYDDVLFDERELGDLA